MIAEIQSGAVSETVAELVARARRLTRRDLQSLARRWWDLEESGERVAAILDAAEVAWRADGHHRGAEWCRSMTPEDAWQAGWASVMEAAYRVECAPPIAVAAAGVAARAALALAAAHRLDGEAFRLLADLWLGLDEDPVRDHRRTP